MTLHDEPYVNVRELCSYPAASVNFIGPEGCALFLSNLLRTSRQKLRLSRLHTTWRSNVKNAKYDGQTSSAGNGF